MGGSLTDARALTLAGCVLVACGGQAFSETSSSRDAGSGGSTASGGSPADAGSGGASAGGSAAGDASSGGAVSSGGAGGGQGAGGTENTGGGVTSSGGSISNGGATSEGGVVCASDPPAADAIYVNGANPDGNGDGSADAPFATLRDAVDHALSDGKSTIYLAPATYKGVTVSGFSKALSIEGGWVPSASGWTRDCQARPQDRTIIAAPSATVPGMLFENNQATMRLSTLSVRTVDQASVVSGVAGSLFGIIVRGTDLKPTLALEDASIVSGRAANAALAGTVPQAGNVGCNGSSDCVDNGDSGGQGSPGKDSTGGLFSSAGFAPGDGLHGGLGGEGANGTPGGDGGSCTNCFGGCYGVYPACGTLTGAAVYGTQGKCGCGGLGGAPGAPGLGGGASVGILIADTATVVATNAAVRAGRGGDASGGGAGGVGGPGTSGAPGTSTSCGTTSGTTCVQFGMTTQCVYGSTTGYCTAAAGTPGGVGHAGGDGGRGGNGHGGPSFAVVTLGAAAFTNQSTTLDFGNSGKNGDGTVPSGNAGPLLKQ